MDTLRHLGSHPHRGIQILKGIGIGGVGGLYEDEDELIQSVMYILVKECWVVLEASTLMPVLEVSCVMPVLKV